MNSQEFLTDRFLIAMPSLADPNFSRTVTYVCEHNAEGAMGIVINRPSDITLAELFAHLGYPVEDNAEAAQRPVYVGGPVQQDRGFVLHSPGGDWDSTLAISESVSVTTSTDVLEAIAQGTGPRDYLVALGYAGWGAGQLEEEMADNAWLSGPAAASIIFRLQTAERWRAAAGLLGVDIALLSSDAGHA